MKCLMCNVQLKLITPSHLKKCSNISIQKYKEKFPNAEMSINKNTRTCIYQNCNNTVVKVYRKGIFKHYAKTCQEHYNYHKKPGPNHPSASKNGRRYTSNGYVQVLDPNKVRQPDETGKITRSRYSFEHRMIMEQYLKRQLLPTEIVHHINGIRDDNRIENLAIINGPNGHETWTFPKMLQEKIRELEYEIQQLKDTTK